MHIANRKEFLAKRKCIGNIHLQQKQQTLTNWLTSNETEVNCMHQ